MLQFVIGTVRPAPSDPSAPTGGQNGRLTISVSPLQTYPSHPQLRTARFTVSLERVQPLLAKWALERPEQLTGHRFAVPHSCADARESVLYLLLVADRLAWGGPMYLTYIATALAGLRCPDLDAEELACIRTLFFDGNDGIRNDQLAALTAAVSEQSGGAVTLEEATADEFITNLSPPVAYLCLSRGEDRRWLLLRTDRHPPFVFDEEAGQEDPSESVTRGVGRESAEERLIDLYNGYYARIFDAASRKGRAEALHRDVVSFFSGSTGLAELFRGIVPGPDGRLPGDGILKNLGTIRSEQKLEVLHKGLSELLDFLLFSAMESLERNAERELSAAIERILEEGAAAPELEPPPILPEIVAFEDAYPGLTREDEDPEDAYPRGLGDLPLDLVDFSTPASRPPRDPLSYSPSDPQETDPPAPGAPPAHITVVQPTAQEVRDLEETATFCRTEATFAIERLEQLERLLRHDDERESALRCREHIATIQRSLEQLERLLRRLRRG